MQLVLLAVILDIRPGEILEFEVAIRINVHTVRAVGHTVDNAERTFLVSRSISAAPHSVISKLQI